MYFTVEEMCNQTVRQYFLTCTVANVKTYSML